MAKKNSAVLWTVGQSLAKGDKEQARHNMGISFESSTTLDTKTLTFVDDIKEDKTTGDLTFTKNKVLVDSSVSSTGKNPVSGEAVSKAISDVKTFYATTLTTFNELLTAFRNGQTLVLINDKYIGEHSPENSQGHAYVLNRVKGFPGVQTTITEFEFVALDSLINYKTSSYYNGVQQSQSESLRVDAWVCSKVTDPEWTHKSDMDWAKLATLEYTDYHLNRLFQSNDVTVSDNDRLVITDYSNTDKVVRSNLYFDPTVSDSLFLSQKGIWGTALPMEINTSTPLSTSYWDTLTDNKFYIIQNSPTPASDNTSPEGGEMFAITGHVDDYSIQLAMGDKLYYRHSTQGGTAWSEWWSPFEAYYIVNSSTTRKLRALRFEEPIGDAYPTRVQYDRNGQFVDPRISAVFRPYTDDEEGYVLTARYNPNRYDVDGSLGCGYFEWAPAQTYTAGTDLKLTLNEFSVDTTSTIDDNSSCSFVLGEINQIVYSDDSFVGGRSNSIGGMNQSFAFGTQNIIGDPIHMSQAETFGSVNILFGNLNNVNQGSNNIILGNRNTITVADPVPSSASNFPLNNILIGQDNSIGKDITNWYGHDTILIGRNLSWNDPGYSPLVLGLFNSNDWRYKERGLVPLRITGGGTNLEAKNVEVMYSDGLIWSNAGFEVSDNYDIGQNNTVSKYETRIYKTIDTSYNITGTGLYNKWESDHHVYIEDPNHGTLDYHLTYAETSHLTDTYLTITAAKTDSREIVPVTNPTGTVKLHAISQQILKRKTQESYTYTDVYAPILELSSSDYGGNVGLSMGEAALPSWNIKDAMSNTDISVTWLKLYGNRNTAGDVYGDIVPDNSHNPSEKRVPLGNLEIGKLAVKFYKETELTIDKPLIPGQKVGDISFIVGDPASATHGFYVFDYAEGQAVPTSHMPSNYITNGYQFCMLITVTPSTFDRQHHLDQPGSFAVLHC